MAKPYIIAKAGLVFIGLFFCAWLLQRLTNVISLYTPKNAILAGCVFGAAILFIAYFMVFKNHCLAERISRTAFESKSVNDPFYEVTALRMALALAGLLMLINNINEFLRLIFAVVWFFYYLTDLIVYGYQKAPGPGVNIERAFRLR